jgi:O-antigen/teichoic acid export membrane protein
MIAEALKDFLRYLPSRIVPAVAAIAVVPILTRLLPPSEYGRYTLALSTAGLFSALSVSWITTSSIRFVPGYEQRAQLGQGVTLLLRLFLATLAVFGLIGGASALYLVLRAVLPTLFVGVALGLCFATASNDFLLGLLRSRRLATKFTTLTSVTSGLGYALAIALAVLVRPSATAVVGDALAALLVLPFTARQAFGGITLGLPNETSEAFREVLRYGLPAVVISAMTWVTTLSDRYVLALTHGEHAVGIYAASRDLSDKGLTVLNTLVLLASTPVGMKVWEQEGEDAARDYVVDLTRHYLLLIAPLAVGLSVLARPLIQFLADAPYHEGYRLVPIVSAGAVLAGLATRYTLGLSFRKRTDLMSVCYVAAGVLNVVFNAVLVPHFGYMAAAAGNLTALGVLLVLVRSVSRRQFAWPFPVAATARISVAVTIMGITVWLTTRGIGHPGVQLVVGVPVGIATYALAVLAVGGVSPAERSALARRLGIRWPARPPSPN